MTLIRAKKDIIICDDFYHNPDYLRQYALEQEYDSYDRKVNWPGRDSVLVHIDHETTMAISHIVGEPLFNRDSNKSSYFRITKKGEMGRQHIHYDPNPGLCWAGVCYLTPTERKDSGTKFWRHNQYGWDKVPSMEEARKGNVHSREDMVRFFETDGMDESKWTETFNVPFKYNRLVLFRPWLFHSNGTTFGTNDEDARLVQLFFFYGES